MKNNALFIFSGILLLIIIFLNPLFAAKDVSQIIKNKDSFNQIEDVLLLSQKFGKDTVLIKKNLAPLLELAKKQKNIPLEWAYYMQLADAYSIAIDNTNPKSDYYFEKANHLAQSNNKLELEMMGYIRQGYYHFVYRRINEAFPYFLKANDLKSKVEISKIPLVAQHYQFIANFFYYIGESNRALDYLNDAVVYAKPATRLKIDLLNSIANYVAKKQSSDIAIEHFNTALKEAQLAKDSVWIGIISGNLATYEWAKGNKNHAIDLIKKNIALSMQYNEPIDAMRSNLSLAGWYTSLGQWDMAENYIRESQKLMEEKPYYVQFKMNAALILSKIAHGKQDSQRELSQLKEYITLRDSLEKRGNVEQMQKVIWQNESERYERNVREAEEKRNQLKQQYQYIAILLSLLFCIVILLINRSKAKIKIKNSLLEKEQLALTYKKQLVEQELSILKNSLEEFTNTIKRNDVQIKQLRNDIAVAVKNDPDNIGLITESLNMMLQSNIMTDDRWINFRIVFDKVYPGYLSEMKEKYDKITENDLKILALLKLDLSNNMMSNVLCISIEGIKKAKQRLRKKTEVIKEL